MPSSPVGCFLLILIRLELSQAHPLLAIPVAFYFMYKAKRGSEVSWVRNLRMMGTLHPISISKCSLLDSTVTTQWDYLENMSSI